MSDTTITETAPATKRARKVYVPLTMTDMETFSQVDTEKEIAALAPKTTPGVKAAERGPVMKEFDARSQLLYDAWVAMGKPADFAKSHGAIGKVHVSPDQVDTVRLLARKSAQFLGYGCQFGDPGVKDAKGRTVVSWRVIDKRERKAKVK
jgi:hypothetical protein